MPGWGGGSYQAGGWWATQKEIAEAVGVPQQTLVDWMKGFTGNLEAEDSVKWHDFDPPIYNIWKQQTVANWEDEFVKNSVHEDFTNSRDFAKSSEREDFANSRDFDHERSDDELESI